MTKGKDLQRLWRNTPLGVMCLLLMLGFPLAAGAAQESNGSAESARPEESAQRGAHLKPARPLAINQAADKRHLCR